MWLVKHRFCIDTVAAERAHYDVDSVARSLQQEQHHDGTDLYVAVLLVQRPDL